jgi:hypothetical protein
VTVDIVAELQAAAEQLRYGIPGIGSVPQQAEWDSLAKLISGTLAEHWITAERYGGEMVPACGRCSFMDGVRYRHPCPTLTHLAAHVRTVLGSSDD